MRFRILFMLFLFVGNSLAAQEKHLGFQLGFGSSTDFGIDLPSMPGFQPYGKGRSGAFTFDAFVGIPIGRLVLYPSYMFSVPMRSMTIENLQGDYIPQGYGLSLPYSEQNPNVIYGDNYYDLSATAQVWQSKLGAFALYHLGGGLEVGSGLFRRQTKVYTSAPVLFDEYWYSGSIGTQTDEYSYTDTYTDHFETDEFIVNSLAVPLVLQWRYQGGSFYTGTSIIRWVGGGDAFWSFRYTTGFHF
jgi:hypothetical protein